jgi:hypothetical protein
MPVHIVASSLADVPAQGAQRDKVQGQHSSARHKLRVLLLTGSRPIGLGGRPPLSLPSFGHIQLRSYWDGSLPQLQARAFRDRQRRFASDRMFDMQSMGTRRGRRMGAVI